MAVVEKALVEAVVGFWGARRMEVAEEATVVAVEARLWSQGYPCNPYTPSNDHQSCSGVLLRCTSVGMVLLVGQD